MKNEMQKTCFGVKPIISFLKIEKFLGKRILTINLKTRMMTKEIMSDGFFHLLHIDQQIVTQRKKLACDELVETFFLSL